MAYEHVNAAWPVPKNELPALTGQEAISAAKRLYRIGMGKAWGKPVRLTSGNRYTRVRSGALYVNPDKGWWHLVHNISHLCHRRLYPNEKPHDHRHHFLEQTMIKEVVSRGWLDGKLRRPERSKAKPGVTTIRRDRILARIATWERKAKRADNALRKLRRQLAYYERRELKQTEEAHFTIQ